MKKFKNKINILNLVYKKEMTKLILSTILIYVVIILCALYLKNLQLLFLTILTTIAIIYTFNKDYDKSIKEYNQNLENEFVTTLNYIQTYLTNGFNVYQSISEVLKICNKDLN